MADKSNTFEDNIANLEKIISQLENDKPTLEEALAAYEKGISLIKESSEFLARAEQKVEILSRDLDGILKTSPWQSAKDIELDDEEEAAST